MKKTTTKIQQFLTCENCYEIVGFCDYCGKEFDFQNEITCDDIPHVYKHFCDESCYKKFYEVLENEKQKT